jgi:ketosteroid isomerase-like protein
MTTPLQICTSYLESFTTGDVDLIVSHVASDFVNEHTSALGSSCKGKDVYRSRLPGFISSMPKLSYVIEQIMSEGHHVWAAYTLRTTVNKHDIAIRGAMHFEVRDGLIVRRVDYWDSQIFKNQAGLA